MSNSKLPVAKDISRIVLKPVDSTHKRDENTDYQELTVVEKPSFSFSKKIKDIGNYLKKAVKGETSGPIEVLEGGKCRTKKKSSRYKSRKSKKTRRKSRRKSNRRRR
jgi:hypothetical protein